MRKSSIVALGAFAAMALTSTACAQETLRLAVGQRGLWDTSISDVGQRCGIFRKHGLDLEILYTQGSGETQQAAISGSVDVAVSVGIMGALSAFAKGAPVRIIGAEMTGAGDLFWYVRADSPIRTLHDADGKTIAYSTNGSSTHGVVTAFVKQFVPQAKPTATGGPAATLTQVMSGQVDVGWAAPPFGLDQLDRNEIRQIASGNDTLFKGQTVRLLVTTAPTLASRKDASSATSRAIARPSTGCTPTLPRSRSMPSSPPSRSRRRGGSGTGSFRSRPYPPTRSRDSI